LAESIKTCFVIAPISEESSEIRKRSDKILKHIILPTVEKFDYKAIRGDQIPEPGLITNQVIQYTVECDLVIADLTGLNPNVFYELAIRHAIQKPYIQIIEKGGEIPFDLFATRTVIIDHKDLDSAELARSEITKQIKNLESMNKNIETPISLATNLKLRPEPSRYIKATCLLLGIDSEYRTYRDFVEHLLGSLSISIPLMLETNTFDDFVPKTGASLVINNKIKPCHAQWKVYKHKTLNQPIDTPREYEIAAWYITEKKQIFMNEIAKNEFDYLHNKLRKTIDQNKFHNVSHFAFPVPKKH
jgi:hypothetical protein